MRTCSLVLFAVGACGPIFPDQQRQQAPDPSPQAAGPPGGGADPWQAGAEQPPPGPDDPYASPAPAPAPAPSKPAPAPSKPAPPAPAPAPAPVPPPPKTPGLSTDAQALLDAHNRVRARHCAPALTWSPKLAEFAQQWANSLRAQGCKFGHSNGRYGENLAAGSTRSLDAQAVTAMWYDEIKLYNFASGAFSMETGHFTQVVWKGTTQLGCATTSCRGMDIWVCEYDPPGNVQGQFRQNVLPAGCK
jgi:uncharacterized protein YkwD